jgi:putative tryptophan/tyrosine transport system substrate-binding protein
MKHRIQFLRRRREFITLLGGAAATWPLAAGAQQSGRVYRIGFLANDPTIPTTPPGQAFLDGLRESGFVEGQNITIERRFARGRVGVGSELAAELVRLNLDLIVASGDQNVIAMKQATSKIPIVMANAIDPVGAGIVASLAQPGGNITGLVQVPSAELTSKRMQLFKDAVPHISRVAVLMNPDIGVDNSQWRDLERAAQWLSIALIPVHVRQGSELADALGGAIREHADALFGMNDGLNLTHRSAIIDFSTRNRMPSMHAFAELAQEGGLMAYATNRPDLFRRTGIYAGKILKGAKPADLPIEQPVKFELIVNLKTAKALGLTLPRDFLLLADEVIE